MAKTKSAIETKRASINNRNSSISVGSVGKKITSQYARNLTAAHINQFLHNRPSTDVLIKNHLVENTMTWSLENVSGLPPTPRNCHTAAVVKNKLYLLGGYGNQKHINNSIEFVVLDLEKMSWDKPFIAGTVPPERYSHCCTAIGSNLIVFGGFSVTGCWLNDLYVLDTEQKQNFIPSLNLNSEKKNMVEQISMLVWYKPKIFGEPPCPRAAASAVCLGKKIYYFGGNNGQNFFNDLYVLDVEKMEWKFLTPKGIPPSPRAGHTATIVEQNKMVVFGGGVCNGYSNEIFFLDLEKLEWTKPAIIGTAPCKRAGHTAIPILNGTVVLVFGGGYDEKVFGDLHMFDVEKCKWTRPSDAGNLPQARAGHSSATVANIAYFFGGADGDSRVFNDVYSLDTSFLLLKNLSRKSKRHIKYLEEANSGSLKNFSELRDKYQIELTSLALKVELLINDEKEYFNQSKFILNELTKRNENHFKESISRLENIKLEIEKNKLKNTSESEINGEGENFENEIDHFVKNAKAEISINKNDIDLVKINEEKNNESMTSVVRDVCNMFESIAVETDKKNLKKKKKKNSKKRRG